jgi:hypothetical protein
MRLCYLYDRDGSTPCSSTLSVSFSLPNKAPDKHHVYEARMGASMDVRQVVQGKAKDRPVHRPVTC